MNTQGFSRRHLLKTAASMSAASSLPHWFVEECLGNPQPTSLDSAGDRPSVALIGCGGQGRGIAQRAAKFGNIAAICDVDDGQLAKARKQWPKARAFKDFRGVVDLPDVDIVVCGTVDHWHALVSTAAMRAGKDVYCEKPLTLTVDEGKLLVREARKTGRILQTGSQQRSDSNFRLACELVRNGRIGKLEHVDVFLPAGRREGPFTPSDSPQGLDWNMWQGPTRDVDYVPERTHVTFRYWWEYSGGTMTDWGAHHNDIALWGMGLERSGPVSVKGKPLVEMIPNGFTAASQYDVQYLYATGVTHRCQSTTANAWHGRVIDPDGQQHGVKFLGDDGWIWVTRGAIEASDPEMLVEPLASNASRLYVSHDHMGNFFDCVKTRKQPVCDVEIGHRSASVCHLGVLAIRLGRELKFDPVNESFINDAEADRWLRREMRAPWSCESI
ncbi:MAG: Gfo/Idh/MocA family oxidoreductase [Fuerstiella sp.]|nr:Gfo/Idh/MocA family oxidoreductase [Fuerstiella sp.]